MLAAILYGALGAFGVTLAIPATIVGALLLHVLPQLHAEVLGGTDDVLSPLFADSRIHRERPLTPIAARNRTGCFPPDFMF